MGTSLAFAIPAYNEADGIGGFIEELDVWFRDWEGAVTFVLVDDRSTDGTPEVVERLAPTLAAEACIVRSPQNAGHGKALLRAYREAVGTGAQVVVQVDGDGQFDARDVRRVVDDLCRSGADAAIARRRARVDPWFRRALTRCLRSFLQWRSGLRVGDPNCPLRAYRSNVLATLLGHVPPDAMVPNVYLSALGDVARIVTTELVVEHRERRGECAQGTMWGDRRRRLVVPKRLVVFTWRAFCECRSFLRRLDPDGVHASVAESAGLRAPTLALPDE